MNAPDKPRWHYRFANFSAALSRLRAAAESPSLNDLEREGMIQRFEYVFELAWKLLKDRLKADGIVIKQITPRTVIKAAFAARLVADGDAWMNMLDSRNKMSHVYDEKKFKQTAENIRRDYLPVLDTLHRELNPESPE